MIDKNFFKNKKILITGGSGMIGYQLVKLLSSCNCEITVVSLDSQSQFENIKFIKADLRSLKSDNQYRDRALSRQAIETSKFPYAEFELIEKISISSNPEESQIIEVNAKGILKLHGVSKEVEIPLSGKLESQLLYIVGALPIMFDDFDIAKPSSRSVLSIEDNGIMELSLIFIKN